MINYGLTNLKISPGLAVQKNKMASKIQSSTVELRHSSDLSLGLAFQRDSRLKIFSLEATNSSLSIETRHERVPTSWL